LVFSRKIIGVKQSECPRTSYSGKIEPANAVEKQRILLHFTFFGNLYFRTDVGIAFTAGRKQKK
jgi:hypothetical protein